MRARWTSRRTPSPEAAAAAASSTATREWTESPSRSGNLCVRWRRNPKKIASADDRSARGLGAGRPDDARADRYDRHDTRRRRRVVARRRTRRVPRGEAGRPKGSNDRRVGRRVGAAERRPWVPGSIPGSIAELGTESGVEPGPDTSPARRSIEHGPAKRRQTKTTTEKTTTPGYCSKRRCPAASDAFARRTPGSGSGRFAAEDRTRVRTRDLRTTPVPPARTIRSSFPTKGRSPRCSAGAKF